MKVFRTSHTERMFYLIMLIFFFITPLLVMSIRMYVLHNSAMNWVELIEVWEAFGTLFLGLLVHNYLLLPLLLERRKYTLYSVLVVLLVGLYAVVRHQIHPSGLIWGAENYPDGFFSVLVSQQDVLSVLNFIMLLLMNWGVRLYVKRTETLRDLEIQKKKHVQNQLEYLKYQINPHFFMNTLNNIHALVDIDREQAKKCIVELSRMMRHLLYESNQSTISLKEEINFLQTYLHLMHIRYSDSIEIVEHFPLQIPSVQIPPLLLITFLENAFKHGVSYRSKSFVHVSLDIEDNFVVYRCCNSMNKEKHAKSGGVGLRNVRERLNILYGTSYSLQCTEAGQTYDVKLQLPVRNFPNADRTAQNDTH